MVHLYTRDLSATSWETTDSKCLHGTIIWVFVSNIQDLQKINCHLHVLKSSSLLVLNKWCFFIAETISNVKGTAGKIINTGKAAAGTVTDHLKNKLMEALNTSSN